MKRKGIGIFDRAVRSRQCRITPEHRLDVISLEFAGEKPNEIPKLTFPIIFSAVSSVIFRIVETKYILMRVMARVRHCWKRIK